MHKQSGNAGTQDQTAMLNDQLPISERIGLHKEHHEMDLKLQQQGISNLNRTYIRSKVDADRAMDDIRKAASEFWFNLKNSMGVCLPAWCTVDWCIKDYQSNP